MGRLIEAGRAMGASMRLARSMLRACIQSEAARLVWLCALGVAVMMLLLDPLAAREPRVRYHERGEEGWFWYVEPEPDEAEEFEEPPAPLAASAAEMAPQPSPAEPPGPAPLSVAWLQENLERFHHRAIDDPTPDNVRAWLLLQRISMDKASAFTDAVQAATIGDPLLDATMERPLSSFAVLEVDRAAHLARQRLLAHLADTIGLVFFYDSACGHCQRQAPVLEALALTTGLEVMAVSLDHRPMAEGVFAVDWSPDLGQAEALGVATVPAVFVMRPDTGEIAQIAQGAMDLTEMTTRILVVARQHGWISEEAFDATRPVNRQTAALGPDPTLDEATLDDPAALVAHLRARMGRQ